jgi:hypothetical protein
MSFKTVKFGIIKIVIMKKCNSSMEWLIKEGAKINNTKYDLRNTILFWLSF